MLVRVDRIRSADLVDEQGNPELPRLTWLIQLIAENKAETEFQKTRLTLLHAAIENGDQTKIADLMSRAPGRSLSFEQIIGSFGQQVNFEAKIIIPPDDLEFERLPPA